jgi:hypothetical protein
VILLTLFWKRFNTTGAVAGLLVGLVSSIVLIVLGPSIMQDAPLFPLGNPAIVSIPLGLLAAFIGTLIRREPAAEARYDEMLVRAHTGLGVRTGTQIMPCQRAFGASLIGMGDAPTGSVGGHTGAGGGTCWPPRRAGNRVRRRVMTTAKVCVRNRATGPSIPAGRLD